MQNQVEQNNTNNGTREVISVLSLILSAFCLLVLLTRDSILGGLGVSIASFLLGTFGFFAYALAVAGVIGSVLSLFGTRTKSNKLILFSLFLVIFAGVFALQIWTGRSSDIYTVPLTFSQYLEMNYSLQCLGAYGSSVGGVIMALLVYYPVALTKIAGAYVIAVLIFLGGVFGIIAQIKKKANNVNQNANNNKINNNNVNSNVNQYPYPQMPMQANRVRIGDKFSDLSYQQPETTDFGGQNLFNRQPVQQPYQNEYNPYNNQQGVSAYDILYSNASPLPNQYQQQEQRKEERVDSLFDQPQSNSKLFLINTNANKNLKTKSKKEMEEDKQRNAMNLLYPDKTEFDTTNPSTTRSLFEDKYASNSSGKSALFSDMFNEDLGKKDKLFNNDDYGKNVDFVNKPTHIPSNILKSDFEARDINYMKNSHLYDDKGATQKRDFVDLGVFDKKDNNYAYDNKAEKDSAPIKVEEKKPSQADAYKKVFPTTMPKILTMSDVKKDVDEKEQDSTSKKVEDEKKRSPLDMASPSDLYTREDYENNTREIKDLLRTGKIMENNSIDIANRDYTYSYTKTPEVDPSKIKILTSLDQIEGAKPANKESTTDESSFSLLSKLKNASNVESSKAPMFSESTSKQIDELQSFTTKTYDRDDANSLIEEISKDLEVSNTGLIGVVEEKVEDKPAPLRTVNTYFQVSEPKMIKTSNGNTASQLPIIASGTYKPSVQNQETKKVDKGPIKRIKYNYPPIEYLRQSQTVNIDYSAEVEEKSRRLEHILESFDVSAKVVDTVIGPVVTRYELEIQAGTSVKKVESLTKDITMGLESPSEVIIQAPIPGKNRFGVEVPNRKRTTVSMREIVDSELFRNHKSPIVFALGKDVAGKMMFCDIKRMHHLLIAGSTGTGKSVCLNTILMSLLYHASPEDVRIILIDPKRVEFNIYEGLPHLLINEIINDSEKALSALDWAIDEMERRFTTFQEAKARDLDSYNAAIDLKTTKKLPRIVIIVDEVADLMSENKRELEEKIKRLTQKARAAGIHLILATQRPSVDVITGVIKTNLPSRISFKLSNGIDSKTILDETGAEKLLGMGDMFYKPIDFADKMRVQGCFVDTDEVVKVVSYVIQNNQVDFDEEAQQAINAPKVKEDDVQVIQPGIRNFSSANEELLKSAARLAIENGQISIAMLLRENSIGYARAGKIISMLESLGYISSFNGSRPRDVYITKEIFERDFGEPL